jgi:glucokinase
MNPEPLFLGVDLGRSTRTAVVDGDGRMRSQHHTVTHFETGRQVVNGLVEASRRAIAETNAQGGEIAGIGIGFPGLVQRSTNRIMMLPNLADVSHIDVFKELTDATRVPVVFDNDANAAAYGEWRTGAARGVDDFIYVTLGTGIGAGIVQGGLLQRGAHGFAGEFGHLKITTDGLECSCGSSGCLETIASGPNIVRRTRERLFADPKFAHSDLAEKMRGKLTCEDVVDGAVAGDALATSILSETGLYLGMMIANVVNLLNLDVVVLGGPVMRDNDVLLEATTEEAARRAFAPSYSSFRIVAGELGDAATVIGSAMMARDAIQTGDSARAVLVKE